MENDKNLCNSVMLEGGSDSDIVKNTYNFSMPAISFGDVWGGVLWNRGVFFVNLTSSNISVVDIYNQYVGSLHNSESCVVVGEAVDHHGYSRGVYVFFTGTNNTTNYGFIQTKDYSQLTPWGKRYHTDPNGKAAFKTYNRTINFFGHDCPPGTYVIPVDYRDDDIGFINPSYNVYGGVTLPLTSISRAQEIAIKAVNIDGQYASTPSIFGSPDNEYACTHVTDRGTNCDIEGKW